MKEAEQRDENPIEDVGMQTELILACQDDITKQCEQLEEIDLLQSELDIMNSVPGSFSASFDLPRF